MTAPKARSPMADQTKRKQRRDLLEKLNHDARSDLAALENLADWLSETKQAAYMAESIARAHGWRMREVAKTMRRLIAEGIEARMSKWESEDERRRLERELAILQFELRQEGRHA